MKISSIKILPLILFMFLYIFMPIIIFPFNVLHILTAIAYVYLFSRYPMFTFNIIRLTQLRTFALFQIFSIVYVFYLYSSMTGNFIMFYSHFQILFEVIPISIFISLMVIKLKFNKDIIYNLILVIGAIQVVFVLLTLANPNIRSFLVQGYTENTSELIDPISSEYRLFGFARGLTFSMPLFQGLCIIIASVLGTYKTKKYFLLIPLYVISIALNARIGLISIIAVSVAIMVYFQRGTFLKHITSFVVISILVYVFVAIVNLQVRKTSNLSTWAWLDRGLVEISNLQEGKATGNLAALTESMWFAPDDDHLILGTGQLPYRRVIEKNSDIGYVQILYFGGILYSFLVYIAYIALIWSLLKNNIRIDSIIYLSILIYLLLANFKGNAFATTVHTNGIILILVFNIIWAKIYPQNASF